MKYTLGTFTKGKKVSNKTKSKYIILKWQLNQKEKELKKMEADLVRKINEFCDKYETHKTTP